MSGIQIEQFLDTKYDDKFSSLKWLPFIGKEYDNSNNKLLIVGESHYIPQGESKENYDSSLWTREFILKEGLQVEPWFLNTAKSPITRNIEKTLLGKEDNSIWKSIAYHNLIQNLLESIGKRPSYTEIVSGLQYFMELINIIEPKNVIFCGVEAGKHFKAILESFPKTKVQPIAMEYQKINRTYGRGFILSTPYLTTNCIFIRHPSSFFSHSKWHSLIHSHISLTLNQ